jgi:hypothetical protein
MSRFRFDSPEMTEWRLANRREGETRRERNAQEWAKRKERLQQQIRSTPSFDKSTLKVIILSLKKLMFEFDTKQIHDPTDLERVALDFLCQAIQAGAFSGSEWLGWRTRLADQPHVANAVLFFANYAPSPYGVYGRQQPSPRFDVPVQIIIDALEYFIGHCDTPPSSQLANRPETPPNPRQDYSVATVREMIGASDSTLNTYAKMAGVSTPSRGKKNHRYTISEVRSILQKIIHEASNRSLLSRCKQALSEIEKETEK